MTYPFFVRIFLQKEFLVWLVVLPVFIAVIMTFGNDDITIKNEYGHYSFWVEPLQRYQFIVKVTNSRGCGVKGGWLTMYVCPEWNQVFNFGLERHISSLDDCKDKWEVKMHAGYSGEVFAAPFTLETPFQEKEARHIIHVFFECKLENWKLTTVSQENIIMK